MFKMAVSTDDFLKANFGQLMSIGLPDDLYLCLYDKLYPELIYDAGDSFIFSESESGEGYKLCAKKEIKKHSDIFLVDHAWSSDGGALAKKQLEKMPQLVSRMQTMFGLKEFDDDLESNDIEYLDSSVVVQSTCNCSLEEARHVLKSSKECVIDAIMKIENGNQPKQANDDSPPCTFDEFKRAMQTCAPDLAEAGVSDDYLRKMYANFIKQQGKGIGAAMTSKYNWTDNKEDGLVEVHVAIKPTIHKEKIESQLTLNHWQLDVEGMGTLIAGHLFENVIPSESWWAIESPGVLSMYLKKGQSYGEEWLAAKINAQRLVVCEPSGTVVNINSILTQELIKGEKQLSPAEIDEAAWLNDLRCKAEVKDILDGMWAYNQTYRLGSTKSSPAWYIMDEVGSAIGHSNAPNFLCAPFFFLDKGMVLSLLWPVKDISFGDEITRNFVPRSFLGENESNFDTRIALIASHLSDLSLNTTAEDQIAEEKLSTKNKSFLLKNVPENGSFGNRKIFCDFIDASDLSKVATKIGCSLTNDLKDGECILSMSSLPVSELSTGARMNHFAGEEIIFNKSKLHSILKENHKESSWCTRKFCLLTELSCFYQETVTRSCNDYWVLHTDNSMQSNISPVVASDILRISRLIESGFTVASKFILYTQLYKEKKFALTYTVYIHGRSPTEIFVYNKPCIREGKQKYDANKTLDEYDTSATLTERPTPAFDPKRHQDFSIFTSSMDEVMKKGGFNKTWENVQQEIMRTIGTVIGIVLPNISFESISSFALFGIDLILDVNFRPIFLGFDQVPTFSSAEMLEDILCAILCTDLSHGLPRGNSFTKMSFS